MSEVNERAVPEIKQEREKPSGKVKEIECRQCGGTMKKGSKTERNMGLQVLGVILFLVGFVLLFVVPIGTVIGIILMVVSLFLGHKTLKGWKCSSCGYFFETA